MERACVSIPKHYSINQDYFPQRLLQGKIQGVVLVARANDNGPPNKFPSLPAHSTYDSPLVPSSPGLFLSARLACEMRAKAIRRLMQALKSELEA